MKRSDDFSSKLRSGGHCRAASRASQTEAVSHIFPVRSRVKHAPLPQGRGKNHQKTELPLDLTDIRLTKEKPHAFYGGWRRGWWARTREANVLGSLLYVINIFIFK
ncbi:MAG: hypothetical protein J5654_07240 [Victivallales bacterium]|nr:hypothetical protein [Victivallales bacterium]